MTSAAFMPIRKTAYPRAGLIGNPSDGYFGRTLSLAFTDFEAEVTLTESDQLEILPGARDHSRFKSVPALAEDIRRYGYYGGVRLLKAAIKRFHDYCAERGVRLDDRNFTLAYSSTIPHLVGLAGSSAIVTACLRALMTFYGVVIPKPVQANLILAAEKDELKIGAGLQDRVTQVYQGLVCMDFDRALMEAQGYGRYEELPPELLPPLYIAYRADLSEGSEIVHNDLRQRFERRDPQVLEAIEFWKDIALRARDCLLKRQPEMLGPLMNAGFDRRAAVMRLSAGNLRMVEAARSVGASAAFTGSGGAIAGVFDDAAMFAKLKAVLEPLKARVLEPRIAPSTGDAA